MESGDDFKANLLPLKRTVFLYGSFPFDEVYIVNKRYQEKRIGSMFSGGTYWDQYDERRNDQVMQLVDVSWLLFWDIILYILVVTSSQYEYSDGALPIVILDTEDISVEREVEISRTGVNWMIDEYKHRIHETIQVTYRNDVLATTCYDDLNYLFNSTKDDFNSLFYHSSSGDCKVKSERKHKAFRRLGE